MTLPRLLPLIDELVRRAGSRGMILGLERVTTTLAALGNPHERLRYVHVTGTNGKGSTSAMIDSIARASGLSTGLYTSPHLCRWAERIRLNGEPITDEALADALERVFAVAPPDTTFFESLTLAAFVAFAEAKVDLVVLEVGIGGRLDATNVITKPLCTAITSIALDHTALLGDTLGAIAREKAGIFKPSAPIVLGPLDAESMGEASIRAAEIGAGPITRVSPSFGEGLSRAIWKQRPGWRSPGVAEIELWGGRRTIEAEIALGGEHQLMNAAVAANVAAAALKAFPGVTPQIQKGLAGAVWPGRLEKIQRGGKVVLLDCAHNPHGVASLARHLELVDHLVPFGVVLLFGALADKAWVEMLDKLGPLAARRVYAAPKGRAPAPLEEMARRFPGEIVPEGREAIGRALEMAREGDVIVVAGSIYLVGEIRAELLGVACDPAVAL